MKVELKNDGVALLIVVFVIALLAAVAIGMLQLNTEDIQLVQNQINAAQAIATAEAGLNDALSRIRLSGDPNTSISSTSFNGGSYTVTGGSTITSTGTTAQGFVAKVGADVTVGHRGTDPNIIIRIDKFRINE
jgi:type II secretory pathway component PulK